MLILLGILIGLSAASLFFKIKIGSFGRLAKEIIRTAEGEVKEKKKAHDTYVLHKEAELKRASDENEEKLLRKEEKLDRQLSLLEKKWQEIEKKEKALLRLQESCEAQESESARKLQELANMGYEEAKEALYKKIEVEIASSLEKRMQEAEKQAKEKAAVILVTAIHRLSLTTVNDATTAIVYLPNHEMKGRVIGREGRNIRILEELTGVNFIIDDTPNAVLISSFDPLRKEIAKGALKQLIQDGRIHPTRIEEVVNKVKQEISDYSVVCGEEAALAAGPFTLHPELIKLLGKLHFSYNQGQNILAHSLEVAHLVGIMAAELQLNGSLAKRIGLLHDIGKGATHEIEGSHALIGEQLALKYGESVEVANGIGAHHGEIAPQTIEAVLCEVANTLSAHRPGARAIALEHSIKRVAKLEAIASQFAGIEEIYALQAGKELRIIVESEKFDDASLHLLARDIAQKVEKEMSYSGQIKVTVIREKRAIEYAS